MERTRCNIIGFPHSTLSDTPIRIKDTNKKRIFRNPFCILAKQR
jgi:hypothetical protein